MTLSVALTLWSLILPAMGGIHDDLKEKIPAGREPLMDQVGIIDTREGMQIQRMLQSLYSSGQVQMAVFIPKTLHGYDIETFSIAVAEKWKLGTKGKDEGALLVIAPKERKMRLEVGYGLEGTLTDAYSHRLINEVLVPYFRKGRFGDGILLAIEAISSELKIENQAPVKRRIQRRSSRGHSLGYWIVLFVFFLLPPMMRLFGFGALLGHSYGYHRHRSYGTGWGGGGFGGGSFGGGGWSGGGGGFGGGGASGSW